MTIQVSCAKCLLADAFIMRSCRVLHFIYKQHVLPWRNCEEFLTNEKLQLMSFLLKNALALFCFSSMLAFSLAPMHVMNLAFKKKTGRSGTEEPIFTTLLKAGSVRILMILFTLFPVVWHSACRVFGFQPQIKQKIMFENLGGGLYKETLSTCKEMSWINHQHSVAVWLSTVIQLDRIKL